MQYLIVKTSQYIYHLTNILKLFCALGFSLSNFSLPFLTTFSLTFLNRKKYDRICRYICICGKGTLLKNRASTNLEQMKHRFKSIRSWDGLDIRRGVHFYFQDKRDIITMNNAPFYTHSNFGRHTSRENVTYISKQETYITRLTFLYFTINLLLCRVII